MTDKELRESFLQFVKETIPGAMVVTVTKVSGDLVTVMIDKRPYDAHLRSISDNSGNGCYAIPVAGSKVAVLPIDNTLDKLIVIAEAEVETIHLKIKGKLMLANELVDLSETIGSLMDALSGAVIITPQGNGAFAPATKLSFNDIKKAFNNLFKSV